MFNSVGSLGKYKDELEVVRVLVKNCTLSGTTNGARIKSWPGNKPNKASAIIFEDLVMDHVKNPIIIDQQYGKKESKEVKILHNLFFHKPFIGNLAKYHFLHSCTT